MTRARTLIATGLLMVVAAIGWLVASYSPDSAGDVSSIEQALTNTTDSAPAPDAAPTTTTKTVTTETTAPQSELATPALRFTVGGAQQTPDRLPVSLRIPAIDVVAPILPAGVEDNGDMEVPDNVSQVGWYKYGPSPGQGGSAVLAAHVDLASQGPGVFYELRTVEPGDLIEVTFDDGSIETYRAEARTIYDKDELPLEAIFSREGPPVLTLITCGGGFNTTARSYDSNVVVYAVPVDAPAVPS
ncbi:MAG: class F sortase [Acidimicrobiia bacterium]|nr:class F sortase [Acidimicrobiia bacterium]